MNLAIPVVITGFAVEGLATTLGISFLAALSLYFGWTVAKNERERIALDKARDTCRRRENEEIHLPWTSLASYRGAIKRGITNKGNEYYYQKDFTHEDTEVYKKMGSKGVHIGSVSRLGGAITKPAVSGRTINL